MNNVDAALEEMDRAIDELGACGVQVFTNVNGRPLDDPEFWPMFERDGPPRPADLDASDPQRRVRRLRHRDEVEVRDLVGVRLAVRDERGDGAAWCSPACFERHPDIKIITHHMGAMIPYLEGRIGSGWSDQLGSRTADEDDARPASSAARRPVDYFQMFYADTALSGSAHGIRCGLEFFGADHVLFGTDCPFDPEGGPMYIRETIRVIDELDLDEVTQKLLYEDNIRRLIAPALRKAVDV